MKILFIGLGSIGQRHLRNLRRILGESTDILAYRTLRQVPTLDEQRNVVEGKKIKDLYHIREFDDLDQALNEQPDIAFITNPSSMHVEIALKVAKAGCHLFIEKPLGSSIDGIEELINIVEQKKLVALVAYQLRFHPGLKQISKWLKEGRIGKLAWANLVHGDFLPNFHPYEDYRIGYAARKELGGGVILTQIHEFDYALWLFGKPRRIFAMGGKVSDLEIDVEDSASITMDCIVDSISIPVHLCLDYLQSPPHRTCNIVGDKGRIFWDFHGSKKAILEDRMTGKSEELDFQNFEIQQLFIDELQHFLDAILGKVLPIVDLRTGYESLQMALAARRSMETGKLITL